MSSEKLELELINSIPVVSNATCRSVGQKLLAMFVTANCFNFSSIYKFLLLYCLLYWHDNSSLEKEKLGVETKKSERERAGYAGKSSYRLLVSSFSIYV